MISNKIRNLIKKISESYWLKSGLIVTGGKSVVIVANFLVFYLLVRIFDENQFGTWVLFTTIFSIFEMSGNSFVNNAIIKYYNDYSHKSGIFIFNSLAFSVLLTLIISAILIIGVYLFGGVYNSDTLNTLLWYTPILLLISSFINFGNCIEQANMKFNGQLIAAISKSGIFLLYIGYILLTREPVVLLNFFWAQVFSSVLTVIIIYFITRRYLAIKTVYDPSIVKNIARYGFFTFGVDAIGQVSNNIGQLITGALLNPALVGVINVANRVVQFIEIPLQSVSLLLLPKGVVTVIKDGMSGIKLLYEKSCSIILAIMLPILFMLFIFSDQVVYIIAGEKFIEASILIKIIVIYSLIKPFGRNAGVILNAMGKTRINFFMVLFPTAVNLILNYVLIKKYGIIGSPIAILISTIVGFILNQILLFRLADVRLKSILIMIISFYKQGLSYIFKQKDISNLQR